jgi:hypothetical protein
VAIALMRHWVECGPNTPRDTEVCRGLAGALLCLLKPGAKKEERSHNERAGDQDEDSLRPLHSSVCGSGRLDR